MLEGEDPTAVEDLWHKAASTKGIADAGVAGATALGALDQALWDIAAQSLQQPLWQLLGGQTLSPPPVDRFPFLLDAIRNGGDSYVPAATGIIATSVVESIIASVHDGRTQTVELPAEVVR